jgi:hypothetical protein
VLPVIEERTSYGFKRLDPYTKLFEERIIFLGQAIDDTIANDVMAQLLTLESMDPDRDILLYINSPGGSFTALTAIYDTMQFVKPQVQTYCLARPHRRPPSSSRPARRQAVRAGQLPRLDPPALHRGRRPGQRRRDPGPRGAADAQAARGADRQALQPHGGAG